MNHCAAAGIREKLVVEYASCNTWPQSGARVLWTELVVTDIQGPECSYAVHHPDGTRLGTYHLLTNFEFLADFPELGGTCVGIGLPTGAIRMQFACPDCLIQVMQN